MRLPGPLHHHVQINQREAGTFSLKQQLSWTGFLVALPALLFFLHWALSQGLVMLDSRDERQLKKLNDTKRKMIKELKVEASVLHGKGLHAHHHWHVFGVSLRHMCVLLLQDSTRFEKTVALIKKFDPEYQIPVLAPPRTRTHQP